MQQAASRFRTRNDEFVPLEDDFIPSRQARGVTDVSFDVNQADFFGFIGPNGAALFAAMIGITALSREENRHTAVCLVLAYAKYLMKDIR